MGRGATSLWRELVPDFIIGADLGQVNDYTAVTIARRETVRTEREKPALA